MNRLPDTWEMLYQTEYTELVGMRVRRLRQARGESQGQLASRIQRPRGGRYSHGLVSRVETGHANPPIYVYIHIAEAFDLDPGSLLGLEDTDRPTTEAELTLVRFLRRVGIAPDEALALLAGLPGDGHRGRSGP